MAVFIKNVDISYIFGPLFAANKGKPLVSKVFLLLTNRFLLPTIKANPADLCTELAVSYSAVQAIYLLLPSIYDFNLISSRLRKTVWNFSNQRPIE